MGRLAQAGKSISESRSLWKDQLRKGGKIMSLWSAQAGCTSPTSVSMASVIGDRLAQQTGRLAQQIDKKTRR